MRRLCAALDLLYPPGLERIEVLYTLRPVPFAATKIELDAQLVAFAVLVKYSTFILGYLETYMLGVWRIRLCSEDKFPLLKTVTDLLSIKFYF